MDMNSEKSNKKSDVNVSANELVNINDSKKTNEKPMNNKSSIKNNSSDIIKPSNLIAINNNKTMLSKNNNNQEAHIKKNGFLSRLTSGIQRFSFRNTSKKNVKNSSEVDENNFVKRSSSDENKLEEKNVNLNNKNLKENVNAFNNKNKAEKSTDFIYIPLKGPVSNKTVVGGAECIGIDEPDAADNSYFEQNMNLMNSNTPDNILVAKPPLPKHPPRVIGSASKRPVKTPPQRFSHQPRSNEFDTKGSYTDLMTTGLAPNSSSISGARNLTASQKNLGLIETNLDTDETFVCGKTLSLMELGFPLSQHNYIRENGTSKGPAHQPNAPWRPHKSMEFLLDKENQQSMYAPENELRKSHDHDSNLSVHQLRIQSSLQKLNVPDWYTQNKAACTPIIQPLLRKRNSDVGRRWAGLSSKTTSLSSLGSFRSDDSPVISSPSPTPGRYGHSGFSRWSTSHLNSNPASPTSSARNSLSRNNLNSSNTSYTKISPTITKTNVRTSFRQPYLGWRSQEKLSQPRTSNERLASSLHIQPAPVTSEIQTSIKEVTSAIVHYVNDKTNQASRSRSTSPKQQSWLESSLLDKQPLQNSNILNAANSRLNNNNNNTQNSTVKRTENFLIGESTLI
jgi:hypothetical protein